MTNWTDRAPRAWARENLTGVSGVTIPTFSADLATLNERAIAHDIDLSARLGFDWTLLVSEVSITPEEYGRFTAVAHEAANHRIGLVAHAGFGTLSENIRGCQLAADNGADLVLLSYPSQFWPTSEQEIYEYTREFCASVDLPVMLFAIPLWGFERVHPLGMSVELIRRMLDTIPNVVAIKSEQGYPLIGGILEMYHHFRDRVIISCPIESDCLPLMLVLDLQFSGTSNTQWMSDYFPKAFAAARGGRWEDAMAEHWRVNPARQANIAATTAYIGGTQVINRTLWKYQDWLAGFNGGPLRAPAMRVPDRAMQMLRAGLVASSLPVTDSPDSDFMRGRHPA